VLLYGTSSFKNLPNKVAILSKLKIRLCQAQKQKIYSFADCHPLILPIEYGKINAEAQEEAAE
jgi:hypothetical protein